MDDLAALVSSSSWGEAHDLSATLGLSSSYVSQLHFLALPTSSLTPQLVTDLLSAVEDKDWVAAAALQAARGARGASTVKVAIKEGLAAVEELAKASEQLQEVLAETENAGAGEHLRELCEADEAVRKLCSQKRELLELSDRVETWVEVWGAADDVPVAAAPTPTTAADGPSSSDDDDEEEGEGWGDLDLPPSPSLPSTAFEASSDSASRPSLPTFVSRPLLDTALALAATAKLEALANLCLHHSEELWPSRFELLDAVPEWEEPSAYLSLLPQAGRGGDEMTWESNPWRTTKDWVEAIWPPLATSSGRPSPLSSVEVAAYYVDRITYTSSLGLISTALSLVQYGASFGVSGLDELGEELSLLSKLVYDRPSPTPVPSTSRLPPPLSQIDDEDLTLEHWRSLAPPAVLRAYLSHSMPSTLPSDIRALVLPYLSVLESRLERAGTPDPELSNRHLYEYVLELASANALDFLVPIFDASKPTLFEGQRLIKSDEDLARLALACLYGSTDATSEGQASMGRIFECLPVFDESLLPPSHNLFHLSSPITPTTLFAALHSFPPASLSRALDALDLHLATAETFLRYSVPGPLSWFLTSHDDAKAQRSWATRMARTSASGGGGRTGDEGEFESEDEWEGLMEEMEGLVEGAEEQEMRKAFWLLEKEEVLRIFFGGLLASGKFGLAQSLLHPASAEPPLPPAVEEELVIAASREFYDNAESGNLHKGDMKLAFDCLAAAPQTLEIKKERDFIEATSRLCSFKIYSHPGIPVAPIEIRLSKDRLDFVARLLSSNEDAYRHPDVILDLVCKLGYRGNKLAEIRALAMIADSGLQAGDFERAADVCDRMVAAVEVLRKSPAKDTAKVVDEAAEVAWMNCFQVGKHNEYLDIDRRMRLLGQALILCPGNKISTLLSVWTLLEDRSTLKSSAPPAHDHPRSFPLSPNFLQTPISPAVVASETTAAAARTLSRAAAYFPFGKMVDSRGVSPSPTLGQRSASPASGVQHRKEGSGEGVRAGISSRLTAGVGWLIGADETLERDRERYLHPLSSLPTNPSQDSPSFGPTVLSPSFGLLDTSPSRWPTFISTISSLRASAEQGTTYKVLFFQRHGQGAHNAAESQYGTEAWDAHWSRLTGDGTHVWGPDPDLTNIGVAQAEAVNLAWKKEVAAGAPLPEAMYSSPFSRVLSTLRTAFGDVLLGEPVGMRPLVLEGLRETIGLHTCDKRSERDYIAATYPEADFEEGFVNADELYTPDSQETLAEQTLRTQAVLEQIFSIDDNTFLSIVAHSGTIKAFFNLVEIKPFVVPPGGMLAVVLKSRR